MYRISIFTVLFLSVVLAILHGLATYFSWYFFIWWSDIPMHILGGFLVGVATLFVYRQLCLKGFAQESRVTAWWFLCAGLLFVGVAWEYFEYSKELTFNTIGSYHLDVLKDMAMDLFGGLLAGIYFLRRKL